MTEYELVIIAEAAKMRNMSTSAFMRSAALGRRADVDYVSPIVLKLSDATRAVRELHAGYLAQGLEPPEDLMLEVIMLSKKAILSVIT